MIITFQQFRFISKQQFCYVYVMLHAIGLLRASNHESYPPSLQ